MNENEIEVTLKLNVAEVNTILRTLSKHPFEEVAILIQKIKNEGESQIAEIVRAGQEKSGEQQEAA